MADREQRRAVRDRQETWLAAINGLVELVRGDTGGQIKLAGFSGDRVNPLGGAVLTSNNYPLDVQSPLGLHAVFPLAATSASAARTVANSAVMIRDAGVLIGAGKVVRMYDAAGVDYAQLSGDADGGLVLGGSGASAGLLSGLLTLTLGATPATTGAVRLTNNTGAYWRNAANAANVLGLGVDGSNNVLAGDNGNSPTITLQALTTAYLRIGATDRLTLTATTATVTADLAVTGDLTATGFVYSTMATNPTFLQSGSLSPTVNYARYRILGKFVHVQVSVTAGAAGTAANRIEIGLPSANPNLSSARTGVSAVVGVGFFVDAGLAYRTGAAVARTATSICIVVENGTDFLGTTAPPTVAIGDTMVVNLMYELA